MNKLKAYVKVYDDRIETSGEKGGMFHSYPVRWFKLDDERGYNCVSTGIIAELANLKDLGYEVIFERGE